MDEFLKENYALITYSVEFFAFLAGLISYRKYKTTPARIIVYFLGFAFVVDLIGRYPHFLWQMDLFHLIEGTLIERNYWWYTIFWWCGLSFFVYYINHQIVQNIKFKRIIRLAYYLYLLQVILALVFRFEYLFKPDERIIKIASLWIVMLNIIIYFFETLNSERIIRFYKSLYFYFNTAIFIWILIMIPMDFFEAYFNPEDWNYVLFKWKIYLSLNIFLYLTISSALIFCAPENKLLFSNGRT